MTPDPISSDSVLQRHGLSRDEYQRILDRLGREPTITELGIFRAPYEDSLQSTS